MPTLSVNDVLSIASLVLGAVAVLLLVAMVAAIALTLRRRKDARHTDPAKAVRTRRSDRIRLVPMRAQTRDRSRS